MFKMSAFSFDARRESFAKAQKRLADCFIRQIATFVSARFCRLVLAY